MAGKERKEGKNRQQDQRKPRVFHCDDPKNGKDAAGVGHHADDAGGKEGLHGVHIAGKARRHLSRVLRDQGVCRQAGELVRHFGAQGVGHFLAEKHQQRFLRRRKQALQHKAPEIEEHSGEGEGGPGVQPVDDAGQQQRRDQRRAHRARHAQKGPGGKQTMGQRRRADRCKNAGVMLLHVRCLLSGFHTAADMPGRSASAPHGCRRRSFRPP